VSDFSFFAPLTFFQKADAPAGQTKRIAGVISTELRDKQKEVVLQRGLDFAPFLNGGWFNDNHSKNTTDVLGFPTDVKKFQKGERLPDGSTAKSNGTWAEGYLLDTPQAATVSRWPRQAATGAWASPLRGRCSSALALIPERWPRPSCETWPSPTVFPATSAPPVLRRR
jgi:hypothetical protein